MWANAGRRDSTHEREDSISNKNIFFYLFLTVWVRLWVLACVRKRTCHSSCCCYQSEQIYTFERKTNKKKKHLSAEFTALTDQLNWAPLNIPHNFKRFISHSTRPSYRSRKDFGFCFHSYQSFVWLIKINFIHCAK